MPRLHLSIPHQLPVAEALKRIKTLISESKKQFGDKVTDVEEHWDGNRGTFSFTAMGFTVSGTLDVKKKEVELDGNLPWAALPFKRRIEETIREKGEELLS
jgi:predicted NBD/HSP70 family sugar kinase